ncbi:class I SAM-dependent methyltransferase [Streptomyces longwoodensis]|uniref:class I SAM-dependent methyltransferase n=1 Tax=Streptomyces TaxID=1883 RepID=UPI0036B9323B
MCDGRAEELPVPDGSVDGVVASLVLCSIADVPAALTEAAHVLRPGGCLYFYEHIHSADPRFARKQRRINIVWLLLGEGCNLDRDTERAIADAGFTIESVRHFDFLVNGRTTPSRRASSASRASRRTEQPPARRVRTHPSPADGPARTARGERQAR